MLNKVIISDDPFDASTWAAYEVSDVCKFLATQFPEFPATARIYHMCISQDNDVTPSDELGIERLQTLSGTFYVVVYPANPIVALIAVLIISVAAVIFLAPSIPNASGRNTQSESPNNSLSKRQNNARVNGRIPDILGQVRATPDLLSVPYTVFEDNVQIEYLYGCVGRGEYDVDANEIRDDTTRVTDIPGTCVAIYAPHTSPNGLAAEKVPQLTLGDPIVEKVKTVTRITSVNGQVARPLNNGHIVHDAAEDAIFTVVSPSSIILDPASALSFADVFRVGDTVALTNASWLTAVTGTVDIELSGTYVVSSISSNTISFVDPSAVNPAWDLVAAANTLSSSFASLMALSSSGAVYIGPFTLDNPNTDEVLLNFIATQGLYTDDGSKQLRIDVELEVEITPVDGQGSVIGPTEFFPGTVIGSSVSRGSRALTIRCLPNIPGRLLVRVRRTSLTDKDFKGTVVDEIKWRDMYALASISNTNFGNVTTVQVKTIATDAALALKNRKLNMLVTRKIPLRVAGDTFTPTLHPSTRVDEIITAVCLDPQIGNRSIAELDVDNIYETIQAVEDNFGNSKAVTFGYTFDNTNVSFEETITAIAGAVFCTAYRRGNVIKLSFEEATEDSVLLFNHRNKIPSGNVVETRTVSFGTEKNYDGVEFEYVDPNDDAVVTYNIPEDLSAINPKKVESIGIRSKLLGYFHAQRVWNKLQYQNTATEFLATHEADILVVSERILVADNTHADVQDGQILAQDGLVLNTSQPIVLEEGLAYNVFVQHVDGTVESIDIVNSVDEYNITLAAAPRLALNLDPETYAQATYLVVHDAAPRQQAFLLTEKDPQGTFATTVRAVNYDGRYYKSDTDFINAIVDDNGNTI